MDLRLPWQLQWQQQQQGGKMQLAAMTVLHPIPFDEDDGVADEVTLSLLPGYPRQRITEVGLSIK